MNRGELVLKAQGLAKTFKQGNLEVEVLRSVDLEVARGERLAIVGSSGSGKSTLLHCLGGLDRPSAGQVLVQGQDVHRLGEAARGRLRNQALGFVYQFHHLLPELTALENVAMPLLIGGQSVVQAQERAAAMLERVGLAKRLIHKPSELSGGERQRAAIARALVHRPACVLADEPTGNLDQASGREVIHTLEALNASGQTLVVVTHDPEIAQRARRLIRMLDGAVVEDRIHART